MTPSLPAEQLIVDAVGARIGIDVSGLDATGRAAIARAWEDALAPGSTAALTVVTPSTDAPLAQMLSDLSSTVTQAAISAGRGTLLLLHAAGLATADGRVSVLVGPSGAGKTTATRTLARHRGYVTDETVGIRADGTVHPYRKPLSVITEGHAFKVQSSPGELGLRPLPDAPLRVGRFVLLDRRAEPTPARLTPIADSEALTALAPHCSALAVLPRPLRTMARLLGETGGALRAEYSEASDLVALLSDMDAAELALPSGEPTDPSVEHDIALSLDDGAPAPRYRRPEVADWVPLTGGRLAVLTAAHDGGGTLRVLAGLAPLLWDLAPGASRAAVVRAIVDEIGDPAAEAGVLGILDELVEAGLLELSS
ncbi:ATP-binding protein [Microbacterium testaceum]|uniref:ATP-binding protein n=1 Tax=Microbacterium testaceum TaxID=2033 RepID=UPI00124852F3|nr:ATP-binding protein [Microbacterium testaceum]